jgi:hypothetical protein
LQAATLTQQRKNSVKRVGPRLVGLPPEPVSSTSTESIPTTTAEFVDRAVVCVDCFSEFLFTAEDQKTFADNKCEQPWRCNSCRAKHQEIGEQSGKLYKIKAQEEAARQRTRRKSKKEQLAEIKKRLKVPIAEVKAAAEARAKAIARPGSMNQGRYMPDAPTGKGELETGGYGPEKLETVAAARGRSVGLGSHTIDSDTGEAVWSDNDRKRWQAQGLGAPSDDNYETTGGAHLDESQTPFDVKLNDVDKERMIGELAYEYVKEDESGRLCQLCQIFIAESAGDHIESVHGDENELTHDDRFGNLIDAYIKREERKEAKLRKAGRDKALEAIADTKARAEADATRAGYVKLNGEWIPKPRTG